MNQTRTFLIFAWLMVAALLFMNWNSDQRAKQVAAANPQATAATAVKGNSAVPGAAAANNGAVPTAAVPGAATTPGMSAAPAAPSSIEVTTDVLKVRLNGAAVTYAQLLQYPIVKDGKDNVVLMSDAPETYYAAQTGWVGANGAAAPTHEATFVPASAGPYVLAAGQNELKVPFVWRGENGVTVTRTYTFKRGQYAVDVQDVVSNAGTTPWSAFNYRQLSRVPMHLASKGPMHPESYSFNGAAWYSDAEKYDKRAFDKFAKEDALNQPSTGGWIGMLQHHFFSAWIPDTKEPVRFNTATVNTNTGTQYVLREVGNAHTVAPGQQLVNSARLWMGPKRIDLIGAQNVQGLDRAVDYSSFSIFAWIANILFWVLSHIHDLVRNWGWAIVGLTIVIRAVLYPLTAAQYKSAAKMRQFSPRIKQLQERYGDDKQKLQMATMELYRKEKFNPMAGCLPAFLQIPIFMSMYWMLAESVELRHAPWIGWIQDLTARDPFFILPILNVAIMMLTQHFTPIAPGMDPMQVKIMKYMPLAFGLLMLFMPAGLVLYWVVSGLIGLGIMLFINKRVDAQNTGGNVVVS